MPLNVLDENPKLKLIAEKLLKARADGELLVQAGDTGFASAPSNIALLKYWGKVPGRRQIPVNSSLSLTLPGFRAFTTVTAVGRFFPLVGGCVQHLRERPSFLLTLNGEQQIIPAKMEIFLKSLLSTFADDIALHVESENNFPTACGVASSAAGYAGIVAAVFNMLNLSRFLCLEEQQNWLSEWARLGSGSATRSAVAMGWPLQSQFVAWELDFESLNSSTYQVQRKESFAELQHCVLVLDSKEKKIGSSEGHALAQTSVLQEIRLAAYPQRLSEMTRALASGDFKKVAELSELDAFEMHAVMATGATPLHYMSQQTALAISKFICIRNKTSASMFWTLDAGANPHFVFLPSASSTLADFFAQLSLNPEFAQARCLIGATRLPGLMMGEDAKREALLRVNCGQELIRDLSLAEAVREFSLGGEP
ncbi:diphosphomevalonate decarboxylase [bacterium]|nr:diphosphomevalonate decarboxylase [bacterium]